MAVNILVIIILSLSIFNIFLLYEFCYVVDLRYTDPLKTNFSKVIDILGLR